MKTRLLNQLIFVSFIVVFFASFKRDPADEGAQLARQYCGSCHLVPTPSSLTKYVWQLKVLPVMASYLGLRYMGYDPYKNLPPDEVNILKKQAIYPDASAIDESTWDKIVAYYVDNSPTSNPIDSSRLIRNSLLKSFETRLVKLSDIKGSNVTALTYDSTRHELWVAEPNTVYRWNPTKGVTHTYDLPLTIVDVKVNANQHLLTDIGTLLPSELSKGNLLSMDNDSLTAIQTEVHRPVYSVAEDLNGDGTDEIISCNFGHRSGSLSIYVRKKTIDSGYTETILLNVPGAVKCYVRDMNKDGRKDIIALFGQQTESVYIFYQKGNLGFSAQKVLQFEPQYGTSDFVLLDYNHDGIDDLAVVHGDNADYSYCLKAFHGLRLFLGEKSGRFSEAFFYPIYGATRIQADDFDQDGDIDFAISSFFPELTALSSESFVYLENKDSARFRFEPNVINTPIPIKSLTLEKADVDQDGDQDLILGQFSFSPVPVPPIFQKAWNEVNYKLLVLLNQHSK